MFFYEDCLEEEYLVTSGQTAFVINLLWEYTTQMIVNKCAFEGLAASYNLFHYGRLNQDESRKEVEARRFRGSDYMFNKIGLSITSIFRRLVPLCTSGNESEVPSDRPRIT